VLFLRTIDGNPLGAFDCASALWNGHREDVVFKRLTHCTVVDVACEWYLTLEASVEPFAIGPIAVLGLHLFLTPYGQNAVLKE
jgi:hypothetical protein